ncbi:MAG: DNA-3-methyladenine glycosylase [Candidatus Thermoplasmatota archaeon]|nr:DNA-3-methyladenine glycosylase [Candidatus Thermoplasmatota archaeon]
MLIPKEFYLRSAEEVAKDILGAILVRDLGDKTMKGRIVETEAYFGAEDPASRAFGGRIKSINRYMWEEGGTAYIYMVHGNWLFNVITGKENEPSAVLIRAIEPLEGVEEMVKNRGKEKDIADGPGKLTKALNITKELNGIKVYEPGPLRIEKGYRTEGIKSTKRIGVRLDLEKNLRFFLERR